MELYKEYGKAILVLVEIGPTEQHKTSSLMMIVLQPPNQRKKGIQHQSSYTHVPPFWSLLSIYFAKTFCFHICIYLYLFIYEFIYTRIYVCMYMYGD